MNAMQRSICAVAACALTGPQLGSATPDRDALARNVVSAYASHVWDEYSASLAAAESMRAAIRAFCGSPSDASLARARETWIAARVIYGRTEVFRFGNGPIDSRRGGVETFVNAWPVDEVYIDFVNDAVDGAASGGIIGNPAKYPALGRAILRLHNQRGGETNVCTGWHAIEFMLWGQDRSETGPGERPASDFIDGKRAFADRRREYLLEITDLLCEDLETLAAAWRKNESNHRRRFEADPSVALRSMITGPALLTGFEMSGERLAVAYETRDQEEEHSCFSDTTHIDFRANIRGVDAVLRGRGGPGLLDIVRAADPARATSLEAALGAAVVAVDAMPIPFDSAIHAKDDAPERAALKTALESLEKLGEELGLAGRALGWSLPTEPQG
ncbi:MAG: imelysin family protein [Phycisphaerae bacterium]|nr:imelysin family protein [Phycisphaerae bacterium]